MALDLERDREPVPDIDDAGVLAGPLEDVGSGRRQPAQQRRRVLVGAVLRPEQREDGELEVVRLPAEQRVDAVVLPVRQAESAMKRLVRNAGQGTTQGASLPSRSDRTARAPAREVAGRRDEQR